MTDSNLEAVPPAAGAGPLRFGRDRSRLLVSVALWTFFVVNAVGVSWISDPGDWHTLDDALLSLSRLTGFLAGYLALIEVVLLARVPLVERLVGFDRLTSWHRWAGHAVIYLALAHVAFSVWGYARVTGNSWPQEYWNWLTLPQPNSVSGGRTGLPTFRETSPFPGIITATVGTFLLVVVLVTSLVVVQRRLSYEWWYAVHLTAYAGIALAWFHQIPAPAGPLHSNRLYADYWRSVYALALALVVYYRVVRPLAQVVRYRMKVTEVVVETPGIVSVRIGGRGLDRLGARAGQFLFWRFLTRGFWYTQHPFSLSEAPGNGSFRITVKSRGDHTRRLAAIPVGTRVYAEGPFGVFTEERRVGPKALLIAGGIGITPVRALLERMRGDLIVLYRVVSPDDVVFAAELEEIAHRRGARVEYVVGDHATPEGRDLLSPDHLRRLVPDIAERDVYISGPPGMINSVVSNLHRADVPRRHLHVERFAL